jgi:hypothetical protein
MHFTPHKHLPRKLLVVSSVRGCVSHGAMVLLQGLGTLNSVQLPHWESNSWPSGLQRCTPAISSCLFGSECNAFLYVYIHIASNYCSANPVFSEVVFWSSFISWPILSIDVSSAYSITLPCVRHSTSFTYKMESSGPRAEPWGTPYLTGRPTNELTLYSWALLKRPPVM